MIIPLQRHKKLYVNQKIGLWLLFNLNCSFMNYVNEGLGGEGVSHNFRQDDKGRGGSRGDWKGPIENDIIYEQLLTRPTRTSIHLHSTMYQPLNING